MSYIRGGVGGGRWCCVGGVVGKGSALTFCTISGTACIDGLNLDGWMIDKKHLKDCLQQSKWV